MLEGFILYLPYLPPPPHFVFLSWDVSDSSLYFLCPCQTPWVFSFQAQLEFFLHQRSLLLATGQPFWRINILILLPFIFFLILLQFQLGLGNFPRCAYSVHGFVWIMSQSQRLDNTALVGLCVTSPHLGHGWHQHDPDWANLKQWISAEVIRSWQGNIASEGIFQRQIPFLNVPSWFQIFNWK